MKKKKSFIKQCYLNDAVSKDRNKHEVFSSHTFVKITLEKGIIILSLILCMLQRKLQKSN